MSHFVAVTFWAFAVTVSVHTGHSIFAHAFTAHPVRVVATSIVPDTVHRVHFMASFMVIVVVVVIFPHVSFVAYALAVISNMSPGTALSHIVWFASILGLVSFMSHFVAVTFWAFAVTVSVHTGHSIFAHAFTAHPVRVVATSIVPDTVHRVHFMASFMVIVVVVVIFPHVSFVAYALAIISHMSPGTAFVHVIGHASVFGLHIVVVIIIMSAFMSTFVVISFWAMAVTIVIHSGRIVFTGTGGSVPHSIHTAIVVPDTVDTHHGLILMSHFHVVWPGVSFVTFTVAIIIFMSPVTTTFSRLTSMITVSALMTHLISHPLWARAVTMVIHNSQIMVVTHAFTIHPVGIFTTLCWHGSIMLTPSMHTIIRRHRHKMIRATETHFSWEHTRWAFFKIYLIR